MNARLLFSIEALGLPKGQFVFSVRHLAAIPESQIQSLSHGFHFCGVCPVVSLSKHFRFLVFVVFFKIFLLVCPCQLC